MPSGNKDLHWRRISASQGRKSLLDPQPHALPDPVALALWVHTGLWSAVWPLLSRNTHSGSDPQLQSVSPPASRLHLGLPLPLATHTAPGQNQDHCGLPVCFPYLGSES